MPALRTLALVVLAAWGAAGHAAGLGPVRVQSALGQPLRVSMALLGDDAPRVAATCVKARVENLDGAFITGATVAFSRTNQTTLIHVSTRQGINEPAITVRLDVACGGLIQRTYQVLLDPVLILPELAPAGRQVANAARAPLQELPYVAPSSASARVRDSSQRSTRRLQGNASRAPLAATMEVDAARRPKMAAANRLPPKKVVRNVLRLSSDDVVVDRGATFSPGLRLSDTLSVSRDTGDPKEAAELRAAHARFAAVMRGEDPVQTSEAQLQAMQVRLQDLEKQTTLIQQRSNEQRQTDKLAMQSMRSEMFSGSWVAGLFGLLLAALAAIGWLTWRLYDIAKRRPIAFWEKTVVSDEALMDEWGNTLTDPDTVAAKTSALKSKVAPQAAAAASAGNDDTHQTDWGTDTPFDNTHAAEWPAPQAETHIDTAAHDWKPEILARAASAADKVSAKQPAILPQAAVPAAVPAAALPAAISATPPGISRQAVTENVTAVVTAAQVRRSDDLHLLQVEEISDLMQEAEFWMLLNDAPRAIEILEPYAEVKNPVSPVPWIYLLDLYRVIGASEKYTALGWRITKVFNTIVPQWDENDDYVLARSLQDYPHVQEAILDLWEGEYIVPYLESLLFDDRDGLRTGFDLPVYRELIHLIAIARDPNASRLRENLVFEKSRPRLISQQVSAAAKSASANLAKPGLPLPEEVDVFDRATSQQVTSKQVTSKQVSPKLTPAKALPPKVMEIKSAPPPPPTAPAIAEPVAEMAPAAPMSILPTAQAPAVLMPQPVAAPAPSAEVAVEPAAAPIQEVRTAPALEAAGNDIGDASANEDQHIDMARKLELVIAYQEIGENVGARVLLEEVIQGGTTIQAEKARAMLKKLLKDIDWQ